MFSVYFDMGISYKPLFHLLIDRSIKRMELTKVISHPTLVKLDNNQPVDGKIIAKLCQHLGCQPGDIMEYVPEAND